jgi:hypothetical protein
MFCDPFVVAMTASHIHAASFTTPPTSHKQQSYSKNMSTEYTSVFSPPMLKLFVVGNFNVGDTEVPLFNQQLNWT